MTAPIHLTVPASVCFATGGISLAPQERVLWPHRRDFSGPTGALSCTLGIRAEAQKSQHPLQLVGRASPFSGETVLRWVPYGFSEGLQGNKLIDSNIIYWLFSPPPLFHTSSLYSLGSFPCKSSWTQILSVSREVDILIFMCLTLTSISWSQTNSYYERWELNPVSPLSPSHSQIQLFQSPCPKYSFITCLRLN